MAAIEVSVLLGMAGLLTVGIIAATRSACDSGASAGQGALDPAAASMTRRQRSRIISA